MFTTATKSRVTVNIVLSSLSLKSPKSIPAQEATVFAAILTACDGVIGNTTTSEKVCALLSAGILKTRQSVERIVAYYLSDLVKIGAISKTSVRESSVEFVKVEM